MDLEIAVTAREVYGKQNKRLRTTGVVPGVLFGKSTGSIPVQLDAKALEHLYREAGRTSVVKVSVDGGQPTSAIIKGIQRNPLTGKALHVDLFAVDLTHEMQAEIPLSFIGTSPAVELEGAILFTSLDHLKVRGLPGDLPHEIEVDLAPLTDLEATIHVRDLIIPSDVTLLNELDELVARVIPPRIEVEEAPAVEAVEPVEGEEGEGAAAAEGGEAAECEERSERDRRRPRGPAASGQDRGAVERRHIDPRAARIILVEAGPRLLPSFPQPLSGYAKRALEKLGVTVMTGQPVENIDGQGAIVGGKRIDAGTVIWGAGLQASNVGRLLGVELDRGGRIPVDGNLSVRGISGVYALGDIAQALDETGKPLPALAQVAKQQGEYLAMALRRPAGAAQLFRFKNRGNTAVIGRNAAVFDFGRFQVKGYFAWLMWAIVHIYLLVGFENRLLVASHWAWNYFTHERGARLIMDDESAPRAKT